MWAQLVDFGSKQNEYGKGNWKGKETETVCHFSFWNILKGLKFLPDIKNAKLKVTV